MHDLLKGAIRMNFSLLMDHLTRNKLLKTNQLNQALKEFKYGSKLNQQGEKYLDQFNKNGNKQGEECVILFNKNRKT